VIRRSGNSNPELSSAARTRSRDSWTAVSGSPTIVNAGRPEWMSASTVTRTPSMPSRVKVVALASMAGTVRAKR